MLAATLRRIAWLLTATLCAVGCSRTPPSMVDNLAEGMNESTAMSALGISGTQTHVIYQLSLPKGDTRPPYSEKVISIDGAQCAGDQAQITLSFYLDQLMTVTCYPKDAEHMIHSLTAKYRVTEQSGKFSVVMNGVSIQGGVVNGRWAVTYSSKRLLAEQEAWVAKYS
jgi:hypothetical protein